MSKKITVVELFRSYNGEGLHINGRLESAIWVRIAKCPFTCKGFNNPHKLDTETNEGLGFDPTQLKTLDEMPEIKAGCDSIYAWDDRFKHLWKDYTVDEMAQHLVSLLPDQAKGWVHEKTKQRYGLTLTGGEPTLTMKFWVEALFHPLLDGLRTVTFETNCAVPLMAKHMAELRRWCEAKPGRKIVWSNSPKLSISGEPWEKAIVPTNALVQRLVGEGNFIQYFKFVVEPTEASFNEVERAMAEYHASGIPEDVEVCVMPVGGLLEQQQAIDKKVSDMAMERGYHMSWRSHIYAYGAKPGV